MPTSSGAFFLVIEGLDGSGKSVISRLLAEALKAVLGERALLTYEPHDPSAAGQFIRDVLALRIPAAPYTLALAYALNRADHGHRIVTPFLESDAAGGRMLVCDRYYLSSLVYQGAAPLSLEAVWALNSPMRRPDLILFMDASVENCYRRMGQRGGQRELFDDRLAQRREQYQRAIAFLRERDHQVATVDANPDIPEVLANVIAALRLHGPAWLDYARLENEARALTP
jgi:dTMP kinase